MDTQSPPEIKCPKCGSTQFVAGKKGFSGKKAVAGAVLTGGIGLLAGTIGSNKIKITCLNCGNVYMPGEKPPPVQQAKVFTKLPEEALDIEKKVALSYQKEGLESAALVYRNATGVSKKEAKVKVNEIAAKYKLVKAEEWTTWGCIGITVAIAVSIIFLYNSC